MVEWDDDRDLAVLKDNNWDDEDVMEAWDAEEQVEKKPTVRAVKPAAQPAATTRKQTPSVNQAPINETEQERKARLEKLVKERDLESAMELFGVSNDNKPTSAAGSSGHAKTTTTTTGDLQFESFNPTTIAEFDQFSRLVSKKLESLEATKNYPQFLESLISSLMSRRDIPEIRKITGILSDMATVKLKEKQAASSKAKAVPAATLKITKPSKGSGKFDDCYAFADDGDGFDD